MLNFDAEFFLVCRGLECRDLVQTFRVLECSVFSVQALVQSQSAEF